VYWVAPKVKLCPVPSFGYTTGRLDTGGTQIDAILSNEVPSVPLDHAGGRWLGMTSVPTDALVLGEDPVSNTGGTGYEYELTNGPVKSELLPPERNQANLQAGLRTVQQEY
jgi:hypothetical protein